LKSAPLKITVKKLTAKIDARATLKITAAELCNVEKVLSNNYH
jgi:hypothetical protein